MAYEEQEDDFDLKGEMNEGYVISDARGGYSVGYEGRYLDTFSDKNEAVKFVVERMETEKYYPNVFYVNDHGNVDLLSVRARHRKGKIVGASYKSVRSWV